jgi:hypothetical protein
MVQARVCRSRNTNLRGQIIGNEGRPRAINSPFLYEFYIFPGQGESCASIQDRISEASVFKSRISL